MDKQDDGFRNQLFAIQKIERISEYHEKTKTFAILDSGRLIGNVKHFLTYLCESKHNPNQFFFITFNPENHRIISSLGVRSILVRAGGLTNEDFIALMQCSVVVTDSNTSYEYWPEPIALASLYGAKWIQLWHGIPMKSIEFSNLPPLMDLKDLDSDYLLRTQTIHTFIGTTRRHIELYKKSFNFEKFKVFGNPRNDVFYKSDTLSNHLNIDLEAAKKLEDSPGKRILYAPTFRDNDSNSWLNSFDFQEFANAIVDRGDQLFVAFHPYDLELYTKSLVNFESVCFINPGNDLYPLIGKFDCVVTDYSSITFDVLHTRLSQILFRPDLDSYVENSRKMDFGVMKYPVGPIVFNVNSLIESIYEMGNTQTEFYRKNRKKLLNHLFRHIDGHSSKRLLRYILKIL